MRESGVIRSFCESKEIGDRQALAYVNFGYFLERILARDDRELAPRQI